MCPGRIGRATYTNNSGVRALITSPEIYSLIAQPVERRTVNPQVGGSNPPRGANLCLVSSVVERPPYKWDVGSSKLSQGTMVI